MRRLLSWCLFSLCLVLVVFPAPGSSGLLPSGKGTAITAKVYPLQSSVQHLYRADSRPPRLLTEHGFLLHRDDRSGFVERPRKPSTEGYPLEAHARAKDFMVVDSPYVSTTSSLEFAKSHALKQLRPQLPNKDLYIYRFHISPNSINVVESMKRAIAEATAEKPELNKGEYEFRFEHESEFAVVGGMPWEQTESYMVLKAGETEWSGPLESGKPGGELLRYRPDFDSFTGGAAHASFARRGRAKQAVNELMNLGVNKEYMKLGGAPSWKYWKRPLPKAPSAARCKRDVACVEEVAEADGPENNSQGQKSRDEDHGVGSSSPRMKPDAREPADDANIGGDALLAAEEAAAAKAMPENLAEAAEKLPLPKTAIEVLHPHVIKGLGWVQIAQFLTNVVDSAVKRLNGSTTAGIEMDIDHGRLTEALKKSGQVLKAVADDTIPGFKDLIRHLDELDGRLSKIAGKDMLDSTRQVMDAVLSYQDKVGVTVITNYVPGVPEILANYEEGRREFSGFKGPETGMHRTGRLLRVITKGIVNTADDFFRNWIPGYREAEDSITGEVDKMHQALARAGGSHDYRDVIGRAVSFVEGVFTGTLHSIVQNYIPGERQIEDLLSRRPEAGVAPSESKQFVRTDVDRPKAALCLQAKVKAWKEGQVTKEGLDDQLEPMTRECIVEQLHAWRSRGEKARGESHEVTNLDD